MTNDRNPWERQLNETDRAWAAFQIYRNLPPGERSYDAAYQKTYGKLPNLHAPRFFRDWANHHDWRGRAEAWDRHLDDIERAAQEQERIEWRKHRRQVLQGFMASVVQAIKNFDPTRANMGQLTGAVEVLIEQMRAEMDDLPTERRDVTSGGQPIQITTIEIVKDYGREPVSDS